MPSYEIKNGQRRVRAYIMVAGKSRRKWWPDDSKASFREATQWEAEEKARMLRHTIAPGTNPHSTSAHQWLTAYLEYVTGRFAQKTVDEKKAAARRLLQHIHPDTPVTQLTIWVINQFLKSQQKTRSNNAINDDRKNLGAAWQWGRDYIPEFPPLNLFHQVNKLPETRSPRYIPPETDFWKVHDVLQGQDRLMLLTCLHLALRRGELFALRWEDIDWNTQTARIYTQKRKGSHREYDRLPLTDHLTQHLRHWQQTRPIPGPYIFTQLSDNNTRWNQAGRPYKYRQHFMKEACALANVKYFTFHAIRHLSAGILYTSGYPMSTIQRILRHQSPNVTERYLRRLGLADLHIDESTFSRKPTAQIIPHPKTRAA